MENYVFNHVLFREFYKIVGIRRKVLIETCGVHPSSFDYWLKHKDLPLTHLVRICDMCRVPISYFFISNKDTIVIGKKSDYVLRDEEYKPVELKLGKVAEELGVNSGVSTRRAIAKTGTSPKTFYEWFNNEPSESMKVSSFLRVINDNRLYIGDFVIDRNREIRYIEGYSKIENDLEKKLAVAQKRALDAERQEKRMSTINKSLKEKINRLEMLLAKLTRETCGGTRINADDVFSSMVAEVKDESRKTRDES